MSQVNDRKVISILQIAQLTTSLAAVLRDALARGATEVTEENVAAAIAANDEALAMLDAAIARAKSRFN